jgi:hypothetical protein
MVEMAGIKPTTPCLQSNRTTQRSALHMTCTLGEHYEHAALRLPILTVVAYGYWHAMARKTAEIVGAPMLRTGPEPRAAPDVKRWFDA